MEARLYDQTNCHRPGVRRPEHKILLGAVLLLALGLRLWGLSWGLPDAMHNWSFHPDETILLNVSLPEFGGLNLAAGHFLPHFYHYGTLPFTLASVAVLVGQSYHLIGPLIAHGQVDTAQLAKAYLAARLVSVVLGVGTVGAVYALGRRCFDSAAVGLLGAFFLAVCPLHAQHSHFATVDVGAAFWLTMSLVWAAKLAAVESTPRERLRAAVVAGIFAGLSAASKYSGAVALLSALAAVWPACSRQANPSRAGGGAGCWRQARRARRPFCWPAPAACWRRRGS